MCDVTDEDFLAALDSNPWLYQAATQSQSEPDVDNTPPEPKPSLSPLPGEDVLSRTAALAAQGRRRALIARIDAALERWTPTLPQHVPDPEPAPPQKPESALNSAQKEGPALAGTKIEHSVAPAEISNVNQLDAFCRSGSSFLAQKEIMKRFCSGERRRDLLEPPNDLSTAADRYQREAIEAARKGRSFFLTGSAGTGKSYVLKAIIDVLQRQGKSVAVTASTGCAAVGISGCTIHSLSGVGIGKDSISRLVKKGQSDRRIRDRFQNLHTLIIDEISMIDSFLFDKIEAIIRAARSPDPALKELKNRLPQKRKRNGKLLSDGAPWQNVPFGGLQVILCGDFFQLPPVSASDPRYQNSAEKFFTFDSLAWKKTIKHCFVLRVVHRQSDRKFIGLLNELRQGVVSDCTRCVLEGCHIGTTRNVEADENGKAVHFTKLFAYRNQVSAENTMQLKKLDSHPVRYVARDMVDRSALGTLTTRIAEQMLANTNATESIELRTGARVICVKNLDQKNGIVNGAGGIIVGWALSLGKIRARRIKARLDAERDQKMPFLSASDLDDDDVMELNDEEIVKELRSTQARWDEDGTVVLQGANLGVVSPVVRFDNGRRLHMGPEIWEVYGTKGQIVATRTQVPLLLGWALSIHKAQGMTLGEVETDVGRAFDYGQVYVALSRATSVHGLRLRSFNAKKVVTHKKVVDFYKLLEQQKSSSTIG